MPSSTIFRTHSGRLIPAIIVAMLLASCVDQTSQTPVESVQGLATGSSDYYLTRAQQSSDDNKAEWQLLAIRALLREGNVAQAATQFATLPQQGLSDVQSQERQLLNSELLIAQGNKQEAVVQLAKLNMDNLSSDQKIRFYQAQITANQGRASLSLIRAYIAQEPLLQGKEHQKNIDSTWLTLIQLPPQVVNNIVINADENVLQGWLDLLNLWQANKQDPALLKAGIQGWQTRYPYNPAAKNLPQALDNVLNFKPASAEVVALFLPMSGPAQVYGNAISQGFNTAVKGLPSAPPIQPPLEQPANAAVSSSDQAASSISAILTAASQSATPAATSPASVTSVSDVSAPTTAVSPTTVSPTTAPATNVQVKVYDTNSQPISVLLNQAQQDGATMVVGPLLKDQVSALESTNTALNVLALNQPETEKNSPNICYFALSPEDEARDAARHMWEQQKQMPLLMVPNGNFGDRIAQAFTDEWQKLGGQTVLKQIIVPYADLKQQVSRGGGLRLTGTPVLTHTPPAQAGVTIGGLTIPAAPTDAQIVQRSTGRSGNIDSLYIVATQNELMLIKPMIDLSINTRVKPTIYASSRSYQAGAGPDYRLEMEGVQFSDIPLLAGANPALMQQASGQLGSDYSLVRLYAMGIDAYNLANHFSQMRQIPGFQLAGNTGELSANANCVIHRKLPWLQYHQGALNAVGN